MRLTCPECGHRVWRRGGDQWTCRNGHITVYPEPEQHTVTVEETAPERTVPRWLPHAILGALVAADVIVHLLSAAQ